MTIRPAASVPISDSAEQQHRSSLLDDRETSGERTRRLLARARRAEAGERQRLVDEVVESHLPLARSLARRFSYRPDDSEDLYQVACLALVQACHRFDPEQPSFVAFAIPTITGMMQRHLRDHSWLVRPPRGVQELALKIDKQWPRLSQELGADPDDTALAERIGQGVSLEQIREARLAAGGRRNTSLGATASRAANLAAPLEDELASNEARLLVQKACRQLGPADQELLWLRFHEDRPQAQIAAALGVSQMQISRRLSRIFAILRAAIGEIDDRADLGNAA